MPRGLAAQRSGAQKKWDGGEAQIYAFFPLPFAKCRFFFSLSGGLFRGIVAAVQRPWTTPNLNLEP